MHQSTHSRPAKILSVPLVLRHDTEETTNNRKGTTLFGHPRLLKLPSRLDARVIHNIVDNVVPKDVSYTIHFVEGKVSSYSNLFKFYITLLEL